MKKLLLALALLPIWAQAEVTCSGTPCIDSGGGVSASSSPTWTGVHTFDNAANTPLVCSDGLQDSTLTAGRVTLAGASGRLSDDADLAFATDTLTVSKVKTGPAATTGDADADSVMVASNTTKAALLIEAKSTPTKSPFIVQQSDGTNCFEVQSDGGIIMDQRTGATYSTIAAFKYQGIQQFGVEYSGTATARAGFNGGGGKFTTDINGNVVSLANITGRHFLSNGTSPTAPAGGGTCGTSAPSIAGKDSAFQLTVGSVAATSCTVTFGTAWATAPTCVANGTTTAGLNVATTTTNVTVSAAALTPAEVLHVACIGF